MDIIWYIQNSTDNNTSTDDVAVMNLTGSLLGSDDDHTLIKDNSKYLTILLVLMSLAGLTGNLLVILSIALVRKLRSKTNTILSSLATADLLVCLLVMPLGIIQFIKDKWPLGDVACSIYVFLDVCLCTSSILHMCAISIDRYLGIAYPLKYSNFRTRRATWFKIAGVWTLAILMSCTVFIHAFTDPKSIRVNEICAMNNQVFQIYGSMIAFYLPLVVMTVTYFLTIRKLNIQSRHSRDNLLRRIPGFNANKHSLATRKNSKESSSSSMDSENNSLRNSYIDCNDRLSTKTGLLRSLENHPQLQHQLCKEYCQHENSSNTSNNNNTGEKKGGFTLVRVIEDRKRLVGQKLSSSTGKLECSSIRQSGPTSIPEQEVLLSQYSESPPTRHKSYFNSLAMKTGETYDYKPGQYKIWKYVRTRKNISDMLLKWRSSRSFSTQLDRERKASQVLGFVFLAFVISWTPFFIINVITAFCEKLCEVPGAVMDFVLWLGYSASIVNPIIYTIINRHFQRAFKDMLTCKIWIERHKSQHTLKACISNINGHVVAMSTALSASNIRGLATPNNSIRQSRSYN